MNDEVVVPYSHMMAVIRAGVMFMALVALASAMASAAAVDALNLADQPVTITGDLRLREELWSWFGPETIPKGMDGNRYNFLGGYLRVGAGYELNGVKGCFELMTFVFRKPAR